MPEIDPAERVKQIEERARQWLNTKHFTSDSGATLDCIAMLPDDQAMAVNIRQLMQLMAAFANSELLSRMKEGEELRREIERLQDALLLSEPPIGIPNVPAMVHQAERLDKTAENWAEDTMVELSELADADFDTRPQQVELLAKTLKDFLSREIAWREAGTETAELRTKLAAAEAEAERAKKEICQLGSAGYQMLGCLYGIHGPARIMEWWYYVWEHRQLPEKSLFPITAEERSKYEWDETAKTRAESAEKLLGSMREIVTELAAYGDTDVNTPHGMYDDMRCFFCGTDEGQEHPEHCLWMQAKALSTPVLSAADETKEEG